jgi:hypothetical protein
VIERDAGESRLRGVDEIAHHRTNVNTLELMGVTD